MSENNQGKIIDQSLLDNHDRILRAKLEKALELAPRVTSVFREIMEKELNYYDNKEDRTFVATRNFVNVIRSDLNDVNERILQISKKLLDSNKKIYDIWVTIMDKPTAESEVRDIVEEAVEKNIHIFESLKHPVDIYVKAQEAALRYPEDKEIFEKSVIDDLAGIIFPFKALVAFILGKIPGLRQRIEEMLQRRGVAQGAVLFGPILECRELLEHAKKGLEETWGSVRDSLDRLDAIAQELEQMVGGQR